MINTGKGAIPLFKAFGIQVYLHWSWFLIAFFQVQQNWGDFAEWQWGAAAYLSLFAMILMHEFGHSLACRSTGGQADEIILWPFGGIAFVQPPQRPEAMLWSLAAGPLVNVLLIPILFALELLVRHRFFGDPSSDFLKYVEAIAYINTRLLMFNLLPIYPLDGGQIFRSLLWFLVGPIKSMLIATSVGLVGGVGLLGAAFYFGYGSYWTFLIGIFLLYECWKSFRVAWQYRNAQLGRMADEPLPPPPELSVW